MSHRQRMNLFAASILLIATILPGTLHAREVRMCSMNWAPFYGQSLENGGFFTELARAAFDRAGHAAGMEFMPWPRAMLEVRQGDRHVVLGAYYDEKRADRFIYSDSIYTDRTVLLALQDEDIDRYSSLRDVAGKTIGFIRGGVISEAFDNADYLDKEHEEDQVLNIRKLYSGRIDMIAGSAVSLRYLAREEGYDASRLKTIEPALKENTLHLLVSPAIPNARGLVEDFNKGLDRIREDGTYERILDEAAFL